MHASIAWWLLAHVSFYATGRAEGVPILATLITCCGLEGSHLAISPTISWMCVIIFWGLASFYGLLFAVGIVNFFKPDTFSLAKPSNFPIELSPSIRKNLWLKLIVFAAPVIIIACLTIVLISRMQALGKNYSANESYWRNCQIAADIEVKLLGPEIVYDWCGAAAEWAWNKGHYRDSQKF